MVMEENTTGLATGSRQNSYGYSGKIMLISVVVLFAVCVAIVCCRSYAHWVVRRRVRSLGRPPRRASLHSLYSDADPTPPDQGLHSSVLKSLPTFLYASAVHEYPLDCAVCLSEFQDKESARLLPKCSHRFHLHCIDVWFRSHSNCPLCRAPVQPLFPLQTKERAGPRSGSGCRIPSSSRSADDEQEPPEPECLAVAVEVPIPMTSNARLEERDMDRRLKAPGVRVGSLKRFLSIQ